MIKFIIKAEDLKLIMDVTKLTTAKNDARQLLAGVHFKVEGETITAESLDGYRLNRITVPITIIEGEGVEFTAPLLTHKFNFKYAPIEITVTDSTIIYNFLDNKVEHKLFDGTYINTNDFIPNEFKFEIVVNPKFMEDAMKAFKGEKQVIMKFNGENDAIIIDNGINRKSLVLPIRRRK